MIRTKWLSYDDVLRLKEIEEMVEVYYNSWQFSCTMRVLAERDGSLFLVYESLADLLLGTSSHGDQPVPTGAV